MQGDCRSAIVLLESCCHLPLSCEWIPQLRLTSGNTERTLDIQLFFLLITDKIDIPALNYVVDIIDG